MEAGKANVKLPPRKTDVAQDSVIIRLIYAQTDVMKFAVMKKGGDIKGGGEPSANVTNA